jgi:hypothetical protein
MKTILITISLTAIATCFATAQPLPASLQNPAHSGGPSNEDPNWREGWTNIVPPNHTGQSFIAKDPTLSAIEVALVTTDNKIADKDVVTLKILSADGRELIRLSRALNAGFNGWLRFDLPGQGLKVVPSEKLIIRLEDTGKVVFGWKYSLDKYPEGTAILAGKEDKRYDFLFRVNP